MEPSLAVLVRPSRPEDARTLSAIAWSIVTAYGLPRDPELLEYGAPSRMVLAELCAEVEDQPVGTVTLAAHPHDPDAGWVSKFFVDPLTRGRGVGKALHRALLVEAHRAGLLRLELSTLTVFHEAIALYEAHGWKRRRFARGIERRYVLQIAD
jgi:GNAT superfamily N-acetyltransferase